MDKVEYMTVCDVTGCRIVKIMPKELSEAERMVEDARRYTNLNYLPKSPRRRK